MSNTRANRSPEWEHQAWDMVETLIFTRTAVPDEPRSAAEVARDVGVTYQTFLGWESGTNMPHLSGLLAWAHAVGYDVALIPREM